MNKNGIVRLDITCWQGMSLGAEHYYGKLIGYVNGEYRSVELERVLTTRSAAKLNKKDGRMGLGGIWEPGDTTGRFDTEDEVKKVAIAEYRQHFPAATVLVEGNSGVDPKSCLDGPVDIKYRLNDLFDRYETERAGEWWEGRWDRYEAYSDEWIELTGQITESEHLV